MDNFKTPVAMHGDGNHPTNQVTPNLLRRVNERRILEAIQTKGSLSRAGLVRQTGISPPTVSKLVRSLIAARLLEEGDVLAPAPGRPARVLHLAHAGVRVLGAVVEANECCIAATGLDGRLRDSQTHRFPTPDSYPALIEAL
ncbi:MAG TPA: helix-turn-helix domain-containing protein, partial [Lacipirellulaceae bacterium]|nr:helix-turn-helix domain-containing protein [Lacipirellulaceae bacterium]